MDHDHTGAVGQSILSVLVQLERALVGEAAARRSDADIGGCLRAGGSRKREAGPSLAPPVPAARSRPCAGASGRGLPVPWRRIPVPERFPARPLPRPWCRSRPAAIKEPPPAWRRKRRSFLSLITTTSDPEGPGFSVRRSWTGGLHRRFPQRPAGHRRGRSCPSRCRRWWQQR